MRSLLLVFLLAAAPLAQSTQPPGLGSGQLANREFTVTTHAGTGIARYFGNGSLDGSPDATRAIVIVHGVLRNADTYFATGQALLARAHATHTLLIAPQFVEQSDLDGHNVAAATLRWDDDWPGGSNAVAPVPISTYSVFDAMLKRLADKTRFPKMREVVIEGHSAGGQIVQRYAVVGDGPDRIAGSGVSVHFIVANPSSYLYFDDWRPYPHANCPTFNQWRYGLHGVPPYVHGTAAQLEDRYFSRRVTYLLGTADTDPNEWDLDRTCAGEAQGPFRFARGKAYIAYIKHLAPQGIAQEYALVAGVPHDNRRMFASACGIAVVFGRSRASCGASGKV
jgi:pimeloyl-ACP methyl ester carboxylesterase